MNRSELVAAIANHLAITPEEVDKVMTTLVGVIEVSLACGEDVSIQKFGRFRTGSRKEVKTTHPVHGGEMLIPERKTILFTPSPILKKRINRSR